MKNQVGVIAVLAICLCSQVALASDCFSLSIGLPADSFHMSDKIPLTFALKNCGTTIATRQYYGGKIRGYTDYTVSVKENDNSELNKTEDYNESTHHESLTRVMTRDISPGQVMTSSVDLHNMFQISQPGTYRVVATSKVPDSWTGPQEVQSNEITFSILGAD